MSEQKTKDKGEKNPEVEKLIEQVSELEIQSKDYLDKLLRLKAEFENYKKRMLKEQGLAVKYAAENIVHRLLPIVDDLDRALLAINDGLEATKIIEGVRLTHQDIQKLLEEHLVEEINPTGELFNPEEHEALMAVESDDVEEDTIVAVLQKGYKLDGKVVRPAKVTICKKA